MGAAKAFDRETLIRGDRVAIPKLGLVRVHFYRQLKGRVMGVAVRREAGRWYVVFLCDCGAAPAKVVPLDALPSDRQIGIEGSRGQARARCLVQRAHVHVRNKRLDHACKLACSLVSRFDLICFELLGIRGMMQWGNIGPAIRDAGWVSLIRAVTCKAEGAGKYVVQVDPRGTTKECSACGEVAPKDLAVRVHVCPSCGLVMCRDVNAARNVLARGRRALGMSVDPTAGEGLGPWPS